MDGPMNAIRFQILVGFIYKSSHQPREGNTGSSLKMGIKRLPQQRFCYWNHRLSAFPSQLTLNIFPTASTFSLPKSGLYSLQSVTLTRLKSPSKARATSNSSFSPSPNYNILHTVTYYAFEKTETKAISEGKSQTDISMSIVPLFCKISSSPYLPSSSPKRRNLLFSVK